MVAGFDSSMYEAARPVASWWEESAPPPQAGFDPLAEDLRCEVAIIGGGYTGLSTALHLARDHHVQAHVLEAGHIGWGASGRNGGFCIIPATKLSVEQMTRRYGIDETKRFYAAQADAVRLVDELADRERIAFDRQGDGIYEVAHRAGLHDHLLETARLYGDLFGIPARALTREAFIEEGHDSREQFGAVHVGLGFGLHPLKYLAGLARAAAGHGAVLHPRSRVRSWTRAGRDHVLKTGSGTVRAGHVVVATNGFAEDGLHPAFARRFLPVISNIVTTRPLTPDERAGQSWRTESPLFNTRKLLFYYRMLPDHRFLIGARGDYRGTPHGGEAMRSWMGRRIGEVFPAWRDAPISHYWRGFVCLTRRLTPAVGRLDDDPSVWFGYGYHGNGVASATWAGRTLARAIAGTAPLDEAVPAAMAGLPPRFPPGPFRRWLLRGAYLWYRIRDDVI